MKREQISEFTNRIANSNKTEIIVVLYDMFTAYTDDGILALNDGDYDGFKVSLSKAQAVIVNIMENLNYSHALFMNLIEIHRFLLRCLVESLVKKEVEELENAKKIVKQLRDAFFELSKDDKSPALMQNTQKVYAGLTYGKGSLNEMTDDQGVSRGFLA
ncbi:flagellar protein FliS [Acetitomaculum ruminis DSM 5522]|uniref:Flagellar protein FliS n=1 Tax=Acetitomaculum ruminis DSM 5522 TaxID=1120918 RepID=A0A1I0Y9L0_9FIRM|nr:flagellar protein FliS [Acetitomaculum ruminis]SFB09456.1 flagellar protein FliS [Acetitomaculum ruminis DSM 5522]